MLNSILIIEPRKHAALKLVIENMYTNLNVPIIIFYGNLNKEYIIKILNELKIINYKLFSLQKDNLNIDEYNKLLLSTEFWQLASYYGDKLILFQTDSGICNMDNFKEIKNIIDNNHYCGAITGFGLSFECRNGGFSLRSCKMMIELLNQLNNTKIVHQNEDVIFSELCSLNKDCKICNQKEAKLFAIENLMSENSFAYHGKNKKVNNYCEFSKIINNL